MNESIKKLSVPEYIFLANKLKNLKDPMVAVDFLSVVPQKIISDFASNVLFPHLKKNPNQIPKFRKFFPKTMDYLLTSSTQVRTGPLPPGKKRKKGSLIQTSDFLPLDIVAELFEFTVEKPREFVNLILGIVGGGRYETFKTNHRNALSNIWWTSKMIDKYEKIHEKSPHNKVYRLDLRLIGNLRYRLNSDIIYKLLYKHLSNDYPNVWSLNLSEYGVVIKEIPDKIFFIIEKFKGLKELILRNISGLGVRSVRSIKLPKLNILTRIRILDISYNYRIIIKRIGDLTNLVELNVNSCELQELRGIEKLVNLKKLDLSRNFGINIDEISNLTNLEVLKINECNLSELHGIVKLRNLKKLIVYYNRGINIDGISNLHANLVELNFHECELEELGGIVKLRNLKKLYISYNSGINVKGISNLTILEELKINFCELSELGEIVTLINLKKLEINHNMRINIDGISNLINLEELKINDVFLKELGGIIELIHLKRLSISFNRGINIKGISNLHTSLEELLANSCNLREIGEIENLGNLKVLDLSYNQISKIEELLTLNKLEKLSIRGIKIFSGGNLMKNTKTIDILKRRKGLKLLEYTY